MVTETGFRAEVGRALREEFGADNVVERAEVDVRTGEIRPLPLPGFEFEGRPVDTFTIGVGGSVEVDGEAHADLLRACRLGRTVTLTVEATVVGIPHTWKDGEITRGTKLRLERVVSIDG